MDEGARELDFDAAVDALHEWVGKTVIIQVGAGGVVRDTLVLIDHRIRSADVFLPSVDAEFGTLHLPLEDGEGHQRACLAFPQDAFQKAYDFSGHEFLVFAAETRVVMRAIECDGSEPSLTS